MKWIGQHIWDFVSRFRNDVYFEGLAETNETRGLVVDADGKVSINPLSGDEHATHIYENVRNDEGATIPVGTPVYSKGEIGGSERIKVGIADASDPAKMPAIGITNTELTTTGDTKDGLITLVGVYNTNLSGFSGVSENDIVYVAIGGGLTITKPTGANLIQNVGIVLKTNGTIIQGLAVTCIGRTNDVPTPLYIDHANQRVGIGATSPSERLEISDGNLIVSNSTSEIALGTVSGKSRIFTNTSKDIRFSTASTNDVLFLKNNNGNVGIGTTSPAQKLHVIGDARIQGNLTVNGTYTQINTDVNTTEQWLVTNDGTGPAAVINQLGTEDIFDVQDDGTSVFYIEDGGNIGMGTTNPTNLLHVQAATTNAVKINNSSNSSVNIVSDNTYLGLYPANYIILGRTTLGYADLMFLKGKKLRWQEADNSWYDVLVSDGSDNLIKFGSVGDVSTGGDTAFYHDASEKMRLTSTGLGIGTTSPVSNLHINGTGSPSIIIQDADGTNQYATINHNNGANQYIARNNTSNGQHVWFGQTGVSSFTERMRIDASGNVGIGTSSPDSKLHVAGEITADDQINFKNFGGSLLKFTKDSWTSVPTHDLIYQSWDTTIDDYIYLKAPGNTTTTHGIALIGDGVIAFGRTNNETGAPELTSAAAPLNDNWLVLNSTSATFSGRADFQKDLRLRGTDAAANQGVVRFYVDSSNKLFIDTANDGSNLFAIDSSGNVGIGTTSPGKKLDVAGDWILDGINGGHFENYTYGSQLDISELTSGGWARANRIATSDSDAYVFSGVLGNDTTLTRAYWTIGPSSDDTGYTYSNGIILLKNGNVGIGTSSPNRLLQVVGSSATSGISTGTSTSPNSAELTANGTNYAAYLLGHSFLAFGTNHLNLGTTASEKMRITSAGNVGIGISNPSGKLMVIDSTASSTTQKFHVGRGANAGLYITDDDATAYIKSIQDENAAGYGNLVLMADDDGNKDGYISFNHSDTGEKMRITSAGNVGIGTTDPAAGLQVALGGTIIPAAGASTASAVFGNSTSDNNYGVAIGANSSGVGYISSQRTDGTATTYNLAIQPNGGTVGIGTSSPNSAYKLHVAGKSYLSGGIQMNSGDEIDFGNSNQYITGVNDTSLTLATGGSATLTATHAGNVGIGTTSPSHKLDVDGGAQFNTNTGSTPFYITRQGGLGEALSIKVMDDNIRFESIQDESNDNYGGFDFRMDGGTTEPYFVIRKNADDPILHVDGGGNVGIGTTSPSAKLEVSADGTTSQEIAHFGNSNGIGKIKMQLDGVGSSKQVMLDASNNEDIVLNTQGDSYINSGNVGIGTTSPTAKLEIKSPATNSIPFQVTNSLDTDAIFSILEDGGGDGRARIYNAAGTLNVNLDSSGNSYFNGGNVGIGTDSPGTELQLGDGTSLQQLLLLGPNSAVNSSEIIFGDSNTVSGPNHAGVGIRYNSAANILTFRSFYSSGNQDVNMMTLVRDSGNVGIGTNNPSEKLEVSGNIAVSGSVQRQISTTHHTFTTVNGGSSTQDYWVPFIGSAEQAAPNVTHRTVAPYGGILKKAIVHSTAAFGSSAQVRFHRIDNGTASVFTNDNSTDDVTTNVTADMSTAYSSVSFDFTTGNTFSAGDQIGVSFVRNNTAQGDVAMTLVWEYELF